jgi:hypothetical protein
MLRDDVALWKLSYLIFGFQFLPEIHFYWYLDRLDKFLEFVNLNFLRLNRCLFCCGTLPHVDSLSIVQFFYVFHKLLCIIMHLLVIDSFPVKSLHVLNCFLSRMPFVT